jgi:hypothetical protein
MTTCIKTVMICLLLSGCSQQTVWQDPRQLTPMSEDISKEGIKRSVGSLRRLAVAPVKYRYFRGAERIPELEDQTERNLLSEALKLVGSKGYTVTPLYIYDDLILQKFNISQKKFREYLDLLTDWAKNSSDGQEPTAEVMNAVAKISDPLNVDGLLVAQGSTTEPSRSTVLGSMILAGPFFFYLPPLFFRTHTELRTDIYEVSTGRIVWRGQRQDNPPALEVPRVSLAALFTQLEAAGYKTGRAQQ